ncbi:MAG: hypothetical protein Q9198_000411 [Flavoplaca austrocitrina]
MKTFYEPILTHCGFPVVDNGSKAIIELIHLIVKAFLEKERREISIDMVIRAVRKENGIDLPKEDIPTDVKQGMFSLLGFLTMLFDIPKDFSEDHLYLSERIDPFILYTHKPIEETAFPVGTLIASLGVFIPRRKKQEPRSIENWPPKQQPSMDLNSSTLNAYALINIGKLKIEWSELFSMHLRFDRNTRTVTFFRFPSFCALNCSQPGEKTLFDHIIDDWRQPVSAAVDPNRSMFREALLSYRLLFGQSSDSRRLFRSHEKSRASQGGYTDQLLVRLCGQSRTIVQTTDDDTFYEQAFYDSVIDFPHYGHRLEELQRRDIERWVLNWYVLMLTIVTIVLALVQIGLKACQVRLAQVQVELAKRALVEE